MTWRITKTAGMRCGNSGSSVVEFPPATLSNTPPEENKII